MRARALVAILASTSAAACGSATPPSADAGTDAFVVRAPSSPTSMGASTHAVASRVSIAAGIVLAGSRPGTPWRRPSVEADLEPIEVPAFEIDRRAESVEGRSDPARVSLAAAQASCDERGARLCDELEWERACEGDAHLPWPTQSGDFADCLAHADRCSSATGTIAQGVLAPEWTRSGDRLVLRGAREDQDAPLHRCDARVVLADDALDREAGVRCCYGPAPALTYPTPTRVALPFAPLTITTDELRVAMRSTAELAPWADAFTPFDLTSAERAYARADLAVDDTIRARLAAGPLLWSPSHGERAWLFAGESGSDTVLAVLYPLDGSSGAVVHGASFIFRGEHVPIAITPVPRERGSVAWATTIGRVGEGGVIRLDEDGVIRIVSQ